MITARIALRWMPAFVWFFHAKSATHHAPAISLARFRCALCAYVAVGNAAEEVRAACRFAVVALRADQDKTWDSLGRDPAEAVGRNLAGHADAIAENAACTADGPDAASHAAAAANEATEAATGQVFALADADALWANVKADAASIEQGMEAKHVLSRPLWSSEAPASLWERWPGLRVALLADDADWQFWIDWYERVLRGDPHNWDMLTEIVLIPDDDWRQGPRHVNAIISGIVEKHSGGSVEADLDASLDTVELRAALADFSYDDLAHLMRMVPFAGEVAELPDPAREKARRDMLDELAEGLTDLREDIIGDRRQVPASLLREMERYAGEAGRPLAEVRPGRLWDLGAGIHRASLHGDMTYMLGDLLAPRLQGLAEKHLAVMRDYFAETLARTQKLDAIELRAGVTPEQAVDALQAAVDQVDSRHASDLPPLADADRAVLFDRLEELKEQRLSLGTVSDPEERAQRERVFFRRAKALALTVLRYSLKAGKVVVGLSAPTAVAAQLYPQEMRLALQRLVALFRELPWPF